MPYTTQFPDTLIVNGTDLQTLTGVFLEDLAFLLAPGTLRGQNDTIPGRDGQVGAPLPVDAYAFTVPVTVTGADSGGVENPDEVAQRAQMLANVRALAVVVRGTNGLGPLGRRLAKVGGGYDTHTANGQFLGGLTPATGSALVSELALQFVHLNGQWSSDGGTTHTVLP